MVNLFDSLINIIDLGLNGSFKGLTNGFSKLNNYLYGIQKGQYYVIMGGPGSGKTSLVDQMFLYYPLMYHNNVYIIYYSLEIPKEIKMLKILSRLLFERTNIISTVNELLSRNKKLDNNIYTNIKSLKPEFDRYFDKKIIFREFTNTNYFEQDIKNILKKFGDFEDSNGIKFTYKNPNTHIILIFDHIGLLASSNKKENIDSVSRVLVNYKNLCKITPVVLMQINRDSTSSLRRTTGFIDIQLSDAKDSGVPCEDADVVIGLLDPYKEKLNDYRGYLIKGGLNKRSRVFSIIKNRYGDSDKYAVLSFYGELGIFNELPEPDLITDYSIYKDPYVTRINTH